MTEARSKTLNRRLFVAGAGLAMGASALPAHAQSMEGSTEMESGASSSVLLVINSVG